MQFLPGCEDMTDSNGMKNQLLLSADPEEDFTDVPSMFKHCKFMSVFMIGKRHTVKVL